MQRLCPMPLFFSDETNTIDTFSDSIKNWKPVNSVDEEKYYTFIADFGFNPSYSPHYNESLEQLSTHIKKMNKDSILFLGGDNFYDMSTPLKEQHENFKKMFNPRCEYYAVMGNHDYYIDPSQYIKETFFNMKNWYYTVEKDNCIFYMIDTCLVNPNTIDTGYQNIARSRNVTCNTIQACECVCDALRGDMLEWLDKELQKNTDKINIVIGHYPIYTYGTYRHNNDIMMTHLFPILKKHNVKLYLSGHEHNTQHSIINDGDYSLNVIVSGACVDVRTRFSLDKMSGENLVYANEIDSLILKFKIDNNINCKFHKVDNNDVIYSFDIIL